MKRLGQLIVIGLGGLLTACTTATPRPDQVHAEQRWNQVRGEVKYQLAEQQYEAGLFEDAVETLSESLALNPARVGAYVMRARAYLEIGKPASAQHTLDLARQAGLESPDLIYTEGVILEQRDRLDEALTKYAEAYTRDPANVDFLIARAEGLVAAGRAAEALTLLRQGVDQVDEAGAVELLAAHIANLMGHTDDAAERFRRVMVTAGGTNLVAQELGVLLARAGRYREALTVLRPLVDQGIDPTAGGAVRRGLATCHLALNDALAAKEVLAEYARANPEDTPAQVLLAKAAIATGDSLTARYALDLAEQRAPLHPEVKLVRAVVQWKRGQLAAAAASLHDVLTVAPDDVEAHCLLAEVLLAQEHPEAARRHFDRARQIDPRCAWAGVGLESLGCPRGGGPASEPVCYPNS